MAIGEEEFFNDEFYAQFPELAGQATTVANLLYPGERLSEADQAKLNNLQQQQLQLSPLEAPQQQGSTRIAGNPYSYDQSPIYNAVQNGIVRLINAKRQKELLGDPKRVAELEQKRPTSGVGGGAAAAGLEAMIDQEIEGATGLLPQIQGLQQRQERGEQAVENRSQFLGEMYPDIAKKLMDLESQLQVEDKKQQGRAGLETLRGKNAISLEQYRQTGREELEETRQANRESLAELRAKLKKEIDKNNGGDIPPSLITGYSQNAKNTANVLFNQAEEISTLVNDPMMRATLNRAAAAEDMSREEYVEQLKKEAQDKERIAFRMMSLGNQALTQGGLNNEFIDNYESLLNEVPGFKEDTEDPDPNDPDPSPSDSTGVNFDVMEGIMDDL